MKLVHVFILREKTRPSESEADQILTQSDIMMKRLLSGEEYEALRDGHHTFKMSVANPQGIKGNLRDLMPLFIKSQNHVYLANSKKFKITFEDGFDKQTNEYFCIAAVSESN